MRHRHLRSALKAFSDAVTDVSATDTGDRVIVCESEPSDTADRCIRDVMCYETLPSLAPKQAMKPKRSWLRNIREKLESLADAVDDEDLLGGNMSCPAPAPSEAEPVIEEERDLLTEEEERELHDIEEARTNALEELKRAVLNIAIMYHQDPTHLMQEFIRGKYVFGKDDLSQLVVNGDMELVLPGYDEVQVDMPPLCRAIYILFLRHRHDGIVLKHFADHRAELEEIYAMVMPNRDENHATVTLNNLCNPLSNTLKEYLSKIKKCFTLVLSNEQLLQRYIITGNRGKPYRIDLPDDMVVLPAAVAC